MKTKTSTPNSRWFWLDWSVSDSTLRLEGRRIGTLPLPDGKYLLECGLCHLFTNYCSRINLVIVQSSSSSNSVFVSFPLWYIPWFPLWDQLRLVTALPTFRWLLLLGTTTSIFTSSPLNTVNFHLLNNYVCLCQQLPPAIVQYPDDNPIRTHGVQRGTGLKDSKWSLPGLDPLEDRKARGLPSTYREEQRGSWLSPGDSGHWWSQKCGRTCPCLYYACISFNVSMSFSLYGRTVVIT
jgi:hypothetical protein